MRQLVISALFATGMGATLAQAAETARYTLERTDTGYVRMDVMTGAISTCIESEGELVCRMALDERDAYEADIAALEQRVDRLEKDMRALGGQSSAPSADAAPDAEFDTAMNRMERFFRRFMGIVKELQGEANMPAPEAAPDRT